MDEQALINTLNYLRDLPGETEIVEFKEAKNSFGFSDIGKYFSALSNEANMKGRPCAWLIFGVESKKFQIVGSRFREMRKDLDSLKNEIANKTINRITFIEIHELRLSGKRVVMFQIPPALNKAKLTIKGKITRVAILLLGREESEHFINPAQAKIRWVLKDGLGNDKDYRIEGCPLLLAVDKVYAKIRNLKYRYIKDGTLFPEEIDQYEPFVIREAINNCIAHQDYTKGGRINVIEMEDQLVFTNLGSFIPGSVEKVIRENAPEERYRNQFLVNAMFNLKMVDTAGDGIRKMFLHQRERFFPLPDYDLSEDRVKVTITGKVLDIDFARMLARNKELTLDEIILLDKVQKKKPLNETEGKYLKDRNLIEGRKPNYYISAGIAASLPDSAIKAHYINTRGFDDAHYKKMILEYLDKFGRSKRSGIEELLWNKLPDILTDKQKKNKVTNLLSALRDEDKIRNEGYSEWSLIS